MLDSKRSNAINIGLTVLPPPRTIKIAILNFDEYALNKEGIEVSGLPSTVCVLEYVTRVRRSCVQRDFRRMPCCASVLSSLRIMVTILTVFSGWGESFTWAVTFRDSYSLACLSPSL